MAELESPKEAPPVARGPLFYIGAVGLLLVMTVETVAVIGRHLGLPLLGAMELMQAAILLSACAAIVLATVTRAHATVHLLVDRCGSSLKRALAIFVGVLSVFFFACLAIGAVWLALEFWHAHEETEVLHIPFKPLRVLAAVSVTSVAGLFAYRLLSDVRGRP